jgi:hypothetical protein
MKCEKCGHDDENPAGICMVEVVLRNALVEELDGSKRVVPELHDICGCTERAHIENRK